MVSSLYHCVSGLYLGLFTISISELKMVDFDHEAGKGRFSEKGCKVDGKTILAFSNSLAKVVFVVFVDDKNNRHSEDEMVEVNHPQCLILIRPTIRNTPRTNQRNFHTHRTYHSNLSWSTSTTGMISEDHKPCSSIHLIKADKNLSKILNRVVAK